jgi:hypothetical protein
LGLEGEREREGERRRREERGRREEGRRGRIQGLGFLVSSWSPRGLQYPLKKRRTRGREGGGGEGRGEGGGRGGGRGKALTLHLQGLGFSVKFFVVSKGDNNIHLFFPHGHSKYSFFPVYFSEQCFRVSNFSSCWIYLWDQERREEEEGEREMEGREGKGREGREIEEAGRRWRRGEERGRREEMEERGVEREGESKERERGGEGKTEGGERDLPSGDRDDVSPLVNVLEGFKESQLPPLHQPADHQTGPCSILRGHQDTSWDH